MEKKRLNLWMRASACVCAGLLLFSAIFLLLRNSKPSAAYIYNEENKEIDYSIARLPFDLASNHLYTYRQGQETDAVFEGMLDKLDDLHKQFSATLKNEYETAVKEALSQGYYGSTFIGTLDDAYLNSADDAEYRQKLVEIYNANYQHYQFLFDFVKISRSSVDEAKGIWYYYVDDLLGTYRDEYKVMTGTTDTGADATQAVMNLGVKLKGATTFSSDDTNAYYDKHFDEMVNAFTLDFKNSGDVNLYLRPLFKMTGDDASNGVLGLLLPYGKTWESLKKDPDYSSYFKENEIDYRGLIQTLAGVTANADYVALKTAFRTYNATSAASYQSVNAEIHGNGNFGVVPEGTAPVPAGWVDRVQASMLFFADYAKSKAFYEDENPGEAFENGTAYQIQPYYFKLILRTSLKNVDMSNEAGIDWSAVWNEQKEYNMFAGVSNFNIKGYAYFLSNGTETKVTDGYMSGGNIVCNYTDPAAINYIGNFHFKVKYLGYSPAYIRVQLIEQFTDAEGNISGQDILRFDLSRNWYDDRASSLCFYSPLLYSSTSTDTKKSFWIDVVQGITRGETGEDRLSIVENIAKEAPGLSLKLTLRVEAVQPNRIEEYWGLTAQELKDLCFASA